MQKKKRKIEENNRRGKTRDLFQKAGNTKDGTLEMSKMEHWKYQRWNIGNTKDGTLEIPKMGTIKDRNGKDLREIEEAKKRWKEYIEELYKKGS